MPGADSDSRTDRLRSEVRARRHHAPNRQMILLRKFEVTLVVPGNSEQGAGAVLHQHEIRDINGQAPLWIERMDDLEPVG